MIIQCADYDDMKIISAEDAHDAIEKARHFYCAVKEHVENRLNSEQ